MEGMFQPGGPVVATHHHQPHADAYSYNSSYNRSYSNSYNSGYFQRSVEVSSMPPASVVTHGSSATRWTTSGGPRPEVVIITDLDRKRSGRGGDRGNFRRQQQQLQKAQSFSNTTRRSLKPKQQRSQGSSSSSSSSPRGGGASSPLSMTRRHRWDASTSDRKKKSATTKSSGHNNNNNSTSVALMPMGVVTSTQASATRGRVTPPERSSPPSLSLNANSAKYSSSFMTTPGVATGEPHGATSPDSPLPYHAQKRISSPPHEASSHPVSHSTTAPTSSSPSLLPTTSTMTESTNMSTQQRLLQTRSLSPSNLDERSRKSMSSPTPSLLVRRGGGANNSANASTGNSKANNNKGPIIESSNSAHEVVLQPTLSTHSGLVVNRPHRSLDNSYHQQWNNSIKNKQHTIHGSSNNSTSGKRSVKSHKSNTTTTTGGGSSHKSGSRASQPNSQKHSLRMNNHQNKKRTTNSSELVEGANGLSSSRIKALLDNHLAGSDDDRKGSSRKGKRGNKQQQQQQRKDAAHSGKDHDHRVSTSPSILSARATSILDKHFGSHPPVSATKAQNYQEYCSEAYLYMSTDGDQNDDDEDDDEDETQSSSSLFNSVDREDDDDHRAEESDDDTYDDTDDTDGEETSLESTIATHEQDSAFPEDALTESTRTNGGGWGSYSWLFPALTTECTHLFSEHSSDGLSEFDDDNPVDHSPSSNTPPRRRQRQEPPHKVIPLSAAASERQRQYPQTGFSVLQSDKHQKKQNEPIHRMIRSMSQSRKAGRIRLNPPPPAAQSYHDDSDLMSSPSQDTNEESFFSLNAF